MYFYNLYYIFLISDLVAVFNIYGLALILLIMLTDFKEYKSPNKFQNIYKIKINESFDI